MCPVTLKLGGGGGGRGRFLVFQCVQLGKFKVLGIIVFAVVLDSVIRPPSGRGARGCMFVRALACESARACVLCLYLGISFFLPRSHTVLAIWGGVSLSSIFWTST